MATQLANILIGQWQAAPKLRSVVADVLQPILDDSTTAVDRFQLMRDIDDAEGVWLDYLGRIVGLKRPSTTDPTQDRRFGFEDAGEQFDTAPFRGSIANLAVYPLPDSVFRRFVKARAVMVLGDGTLQTFRKAVLEVDPRATVVDNRDMTVTVTTGLRSFMELADEINALPRTAGVRIIYA